MFLTKKIQDQEKMPQIILKRLTAHLVSYTSRDVNHYKKTSISQPYQPPRTPYLQNSYTSYFHPVNITKFLRTAVFFKSKAQKPCKGQNWHALSHEQHFLKHLFLDICQCAFKMILYHHKTALTKNSKSLHKSHN